MSMPGINPLPFRMSKRYKNQKSLSQALEEFIRTNRLRHGIDKVDARAAWNEVMGPGVKTYTTQVELRHDTLYVSLSSAVLREELSMGQSKIIQMLNEALGKDLIRNVVLR